jgi:Tfp pilus assembly protein PilO
MTARRFKFDIRQAGPKILLVLLVLLVANAGFYLMATRPKAMAYQRLAQGSETELNALERRKREVERREAFLGALQQAETDLKSIREDVLSTRELRLVEVQAELETLCRRFHIDLNSVTYDSELLKSEDLDKLIMVVPLQGSYANLRSFLQAVEDSDKFMLVERVALAEGKEGGVLLELSITLATYFDAPDGENGRRV